MWRLWHCLWDHFGPIQCFSEARWQSITCMNIYPFWALHRTALVSAFRLFANLANLASHMLHRWSLQVDNRSLGRMESCWKKDMDSIQPFQHSSYVLGDLLGHLLSNGTNWRRQGSYEWGKSGPAETGLTGLMATAVENEVYWCSFQNRAWPQLPCNWINIFHHGTGGTVLGYSLFATKPTIIVLSHGQSKAFCYTSPIHWILMTHLYISCYTNCQSILLYLDD